MTEADRSFLRALETCQIPNTRFGHREHLRAAWIYIQCDGFANALPNLERTIRRFASHHGHEQKFHYTLTAAWTTCVAAHMAGHRQSSFEAFIQENSALLDTRLLLRFYSRERLFSDVARSRFIPADLRTLPSAQG